MSERYYELANETIEYNGIILHKIRAIIDLPQHDVKAGDLGGFVESYDNLSDNAWVYDNAKVYENAKVCGDAEVLGHAKVYGNARVYDDAKVFGAARVFGNADVFGDTRVCDYAKVYGAARVADDARVYGNAQVFGYARVGGNALVFGNAQVCEAAEVFGYAEVLGDAVVKSIKDYIVFKNFWSSGRYFTWTRSNNMWSVGCFYGTGEELIKKAYKDSEESGKLYEYTVKSVNEMNKLLKKGE